jgi:hypothetical protein
MRAQCRRQRWHGYGMIENVSASCNACVNARLPHAAKGKCHA